MSQDRGGQALLLARGPFQPSHNGSPLNNYSRLLLRILYPGQLLVATILVGRGSVLPFGLSGVVSTGPVACPDSLDIDDDLTRASEGTLRTVNARCQSLREGVGG